MRPLPRSHPSRITDVRPELERSTAGAAFSGFAVPGPPKRRLGKRIEGPRLGTPSASRCRDIRREPLANFCPIFDRKLAILPWSRGFGRFTDFWRLPKSAFPPGKGGVQGGSRLCAILVACYLAFLVPIGISAALDQAWARGRSVDNPCPGVSGNFLELVLSILSVRCGKFIISIYPDKNYASA